VATIRKFQLNDLPLVLQIERAAFASEGYSAGTFLAHAFRDRRSFFVAEEEEHAVVGFVLVRRGLRWLGSRRGGITSIAVAPAHRRRGLGRLLMVAALDYLRSQHMTVADLEVNAVNRAAQSLYESLGFRRCRVLPNYYGNHRDGLQMVLNLIDPNADPCPPRPFDAGRPEE
jgi:[ribosomal protein S18]-alanine N-acetyltransferase